MRLRSIATGGGALLLAFLALSVVVTVGGLVLRGGGSPGGSEPAPSSAAPSSVTSGPVRPPVGDFGADPARLGPAISVTAAGSDDFPPPPPIVGELTDGAVVPVTASGFRGNTDGAARQCAGARCGPSLPVRFDGGGRARFLFLLADEILGGPPCRGATRCGLVVSDAAGRRALAVTVFGATPVATPAVAVTPRAGLHDGAAVRVAISGFRPGADVTVVQCVAPDAAGARRCGAPGPVVDATLDARGAATVDFTVRTGRVGIEPGVRCERGARCGISVVVDGVAAAPVVRLAFASAPTAEYDSGRLALGLALAFALAAVATLIGTRTRWRLAPDPFA